MAPSFEILIGRIESLALDAVVNAANRALLPGTGVDGALRAAAGPALTRHTSRLPPLDVGEAVITPGYDLPARFVIHTAAPIFDPDADERVLSQGLARCYGNSLSLALQNRVATIAFPCLGTGNFGWPRELACEIAIEACHASAAARVLDRIVFCCFTAADAAPYHSRLG